MQEQSNTPVEAQVQSQEPQPVQVEVTPVVVVPSTPPPPSEPEKPKGFSRTDVKRHIEIPLHFPSLYSDVVFTFKLRLKLSGTAEEERQKWLDLSPQKRTETYREQALREVCDLLVDMPTGLLDLKYDGRSNKSSLKNYIETETDQDAKEFLYMLVEGVDSAYWNAIAPREFRKPL